ncbi:MAG: hypothetical protein ACD_59C00024G0006 [uncultured bacterium]|nr:MAG: hypothetical protein ACD_59C00024G0006 [uncultured bacterium]
MLKDLELQPVYDSEKFDLIRDLQVPLLTNAIDYLRGVGFFTSGWLRLAAAGITNLVKNGGKARIILSPILEEADWAALNLGETAKNDSFLREILFRNLEDLSSNLEYDTRNTLAWMIADGILEFRFALPRDRKSAGDYHDKVAVFTDKNSDMVAIHGSLNDSIKASLNGEAFSVFNSWSSGQIPYVEMHNLRLEALWNNQNKQFRIYLIPDAIHEKLIQLRTSAEPPYARMKSSDLSPTIQFEKTSGPCCSVKLHDYQETAIEKWYEAECRGIFEMATGTGKTFTSLAAATSVYKKKGRLALLIFVPYLHLLEQWGRNCRQFGFEPIICSGEHGRWQIEVKSAIQDFNIGVKSNICAIAVHKTAATDKFTKAIQRLPINNTMLIGDEAHGLGAKHLRKALTKKAGLRLGLSATPRRWFDEEGTDTIFNYFGPPCFEYTIDQAIGEFLTPYDYHPQLVSLTNEEYEQYEELTRKIVVISTRAECDQKLHEQLKILLLKRAHIISAAQQKLPLLLKLLANIQECCRKNAVEPTGILIYCPPGGHKEILKAVSALGLRCHEFVCDVNLQDREKLLLQFDAGDIQVLVAIKCLDEGVDVPSTKTAFILASSTNPREFVQRRGRILRKVKGKHHADIYDFIVTPVLERQELKLDTDANILKREMPRFAEFASSAKNKFEARSTLWDILNQFEMLNLFDEKPWDVYHKLKLFDWSE